MKLSKLNYLLNQNEKIDKYTKNFESPSYWSNGFLLFKKEFFKAEIEYLTDLAKLKNVPIVDKTDEEMELAFADMQEILFEETNLYWCIQPKKKYQIFLTSDSIFCYNEKHLEILEELNQIHFEVLNEGSRYLLTNSDRSFILMNVKTSLDYKITRLK